MRLSDPNLLARIFTSLVQQKGLTSYEVRMISRLQEQHLVVHPSNYKVSKFITIVMRRNIHPLANSYLTVTFLR